MNQRENQGLQIAMVIFVIVSLVLGCTSIYFFQKYDAERQKATAAATQSVTLQQRLDEQQAGLGDVMTRIGHPQSTTVEQAVAGHADYMQRYGSHLPDTRQTYRDVIAAERTSVEREQQVVVDKQRKNMAQQQTIESLEDVHSQRVQAANTAQQRSQQELNAERDRFRETVVDLNNKQQQLVADVKQRGREFLESMQHYRDDNRKLARELASAEDVINKQTRKLAGFQAGTAVNPDGLILEVDYRSLTARIDLGRADRLPVQQVFSVHPSGTPEMKLSGKHGTRKGSVEVIRLLGDHHAVVKLLDYTLSDPILPGDKIYTPLWHPGRRPRFAIIGEIHIDQDGVDDRTQLRNLIAGGGGVIEVDLQPDGKQVGTEITPEIDFLVRGEAPKFGDHLRETLQAMANLETAARQLGARVVTPNQLLDESGYWRARARTYRPGIDEPSFRASPKFPNRAYR